MSRIYYFGTHYPYVIMFLLGVQKVLINEYDKKECIYSFHGI